MENENQKTVISSFSTKFPLNAFEIINLKKNLSSQYDLIKVVEIQNCPSTCDASKLLLNSIFTSILESLKNIKILILKINEKLDEKYAIKPSINQLKIKTNFLISYESTVEECLSEENSNVKKCASQKIIYWKNGNDGCYSTFKILKGYSIRLTDFVRDFLIDIVDSKQADISPLNSLELSMSIINLKDSNNYNLLMKAVESEQSPSLINELLNLPFNINQQSSDGKIAADIAWENKNFQILLKLLENNSRFPIHFYPDDLEENEESKGIKAFLEISHDFHSAIQENNFTKISQIIKQKPNLRYFYDLSNKSAATTALNTKRFKPYQILLEHECSIGPNENLNEILDSVYSNDEDYESKRKKIKLAITNTHSNVSKPLPEKHLLVLCANSHICHDDQHDKHRLKYIRNAYEILNEIPLTRQILQIIAAHKNFKIYFDFNRTSIEFMNPYTGDALTRGAGECFDFNNYRIYISARELLDSDTKFEALGTLAHELCHFAMYLTFFNDAKPYAIDDEENKSNFSDICDKYRQMDVKDIVLKQAFNYEDVHSELIVRVPHTIVRYHNDSIRLNELKVIFKELFDYYNDVVVAKINETQLMFEKLFNDSIDIKYEELTEAYKTKLHHSDVNFQGVRVKFNEIIEDKNSEIFNYLTGKQIRAILINDHVMNIGSASPIDTEFYIERYFIDTRENSKTFDEILSVAESKKLILLSDHAGEGKTTTFKHLSVKLKEKFPNFWVSYIDLKRHLKVYEKYEKNFNENQIATILLDIFNITNDLIDSDIFIHIFNSNRAIFLYDSVDEISPKFKEFFIKIIESVRNSTMNQQWIATRPQYIQELSQKYETESYKLLPFDETKKSEFAKNILKRNNIECDNFDYNFQLNNPLILQMITELYVNDKSIVNSYNVYSLYEEIIQMKADVISEKGSIVNLDRDCIRSRLSIWQIHQIYALKLLFSNNQEEFDINDFLMLRKWKREKFRWTPESISRYGFLIINDWNTESEYPDFVHQTFAEFFFAQLIIENIFELDEDDDEVSDREIELTLELLMIQKNSNVLDFIISYLSNQLKRKLNERVLKTILCDKLASNFYKNNHNEIAVKLTEIFSIDERFLKQFRDYEKTIFQIFFTTKWDKLDIFLKIIEIYEKSLGFEWIFYTGYSIKEAIISDEEVNSIFLSQLKDDDKKVTKMCKNLFKLLSFMEKSEMSKTEVENFLFRHDYDIYCYLFKSRALIEQFVVIFKKIASKEIEKIFISQILNQKSLTIKSSNDLNDALLPNINFFLEKVQQILYSNEKQTDDFKMARVKIFTNYGSVTKIQDLYQKHSFCTQNEVQEFLIKYYREFIEALCNTIHSENIINEAPFREIFLENQKFNNQLKKFLDLSSNFVKVQIESCESKENDCYKNYLQMEKILSELIKEYAKESMELLQLSLKKAKIDKSE